MRRTDAPRFAALLTLLGLTAALLGLLTAPAGATTASMPPELQKYTPGSQAWATAPWTTAPSCSDRGGDFSMWTSSVIADTPALLTHFQNATFGPDTNAADQARGNAILDGYRTLSDTFTGAVPNGYCAADVKSWQASPAQAAPFGFAWGMTPTDGHRTMYSCAPDSTAGNSIQAVENTIGADRAMCDGFYIDCSKALASDHTRCEAWNAFSDRYVRAIDQLRHDAISQHPALVRNTAVSTSTASWSWIAIAAGVAIAAAACGLVLRRRLAPFGKRSPGE